MASNSAATRIILTFAAGFLAVIAGHQIVVAGLNAAGLMPAGFPPWSMEPVPPFGVPTVISKAFWGGLWALLLALILNNTRGAVYWIGWTLVGAVALSLVAIFVVPPLKGAAIPSFAERFPIYAAVNATWGFVTALLLRVFGQGGA